MPISEPGTRNNGPKPGTSNRNRNTIGNGGYGGSGGIGYPGIPPLSPSSTYSYASELAALRTSYLRQLSTLRQSVKGYKSQFRADRANLKAARLEGMGDAIEGANERGMLGASTDIEARIGVRAEFARGLA